MPLSTFVPHITATVHLSLQKIRAKGVDTPRIIPSTFSKDKIWGHSSAYLTQTPEVSLKRTQERTYK